MECFVLPVYCILWLLCTSCAICKNKETIIIIIIIFLLLLHYYLLCTMNCPHLNIGFDVGKVVRPHGKGLRFFNQSQIPQSRQLQCDVLQRIGRLVDNQHIQHDVVLN